MGLLCWVDKGGSSMWMLKEDTVLIIEGCLNMDVFLVCRLMVVAVGLGFVLLAPMSWAFVWFS